VGFASAIHLATKVVALVHAVESQPSVHDGYDRVGARIRS
jgi:hypothetical protein